MSSILVPPTFRLASLKRYTPKFSGAPQKLTWCQQFGVQVLPKSGKSDLCPSKIGDFEVFFCTKSIFLAKRSIVAYSIPYIFWKLLFQRLIWHILGPAKCILWPVRFFATFWKSTGSISWNLFIVQWRVQCSNTRPNWKLNWQILKQIQITTEWDPNTLVQWWLTEHHAGLGRPQSLFRGQVLEEGHPLTTNI